MLRFKTIVKLTDWHFLTQSFNFTFKSLHIHTPLLYLKLGEMEQFLCELYYFFSQNVETDMEKKVTALSLIKTKDLPELSK